MAYEVNVNRLLWKQHAVQLLSLSSSYASMPDVPLRVDSEIAAMSIPENTSMIVEPNTVTDTSQGEGHCTNIEPGPSLMATKTCP